MNFKNIVFISLVLVACGKKETTKEVEAPKQLGPTEQKEQPPIIVQVPQQTPMPTDQGKGPGQGPGDNDDGAQPNPGPGPGPQPDPGPQPVPVPDPCVGYPYPTGPCAPGPGGPVVVGGPVNPCLGPVVATTPCVPVGFPHGPRIPLGIPRGPLGSLEQDCYRVELITCQIENFVAGEVNGLRAQRGLPLLAANFQIAFSARDWSITQAANLLPIVPADLAQRIAVMQLEFGPQNVVFGSGINGLLVAQTEAVSAVVTVDGVTPDVVAIGNLIFQALISNPTSLGVLTDPTLRSFGTGIAIQGASVYVTQLFSN